MRHDPDAEIEGTTAEYRRDPEGVFHDADQDRRLHAEHRRRGARSTVSRERAEATKKAVASMRIDPSRIDVERYGSQHPVAWDEEGRARFSVRVVLELWRGRQRPLPPERVGGGSPSAGSAQAEGSSPQRSAKDCHE